MDSLNDILGRKDFDLPPEIVAIKKYIRDEFQEEVEVMVRERDIVVACNSAALAGTLRMRGPILKKLAATDKRLVFRIG
ncbi:MAG TPA: hypothetical protein VLG37_04550 [Candidatus Saccharimonadales bacterium]|nr:hypothetical protein [Candidatus Saccharimonadales bacterium]